MELLHTATLVHDDILDGALVRRMKPTLHSLEGEEIVELVSCNLEDARCDAL